MTGNHGELAKALRSVCEEAKIDNDHMVKDALRLVLAFMRIGDSSVRRAIIDIAERIPERCGNNSV